MDTRLARRMAPGMALILAWSAIPGITAAQSPRPVVQRATRDARWQPQRPLDAPRANAATRPALDVSRREVGFALRSLREGRSPTQPGFARSHLLTNRLGALRRGVLHLGARRAFLARMLDTMEEHFGAPLTTLRRGSVDDLDGLRLDKALILRDYHRTPALLRDALVSARGTVDGHAIDDRQVFVRDWLPAEPSSAPGRSMVAHRRPLGLHVVVTPGYMETNETWMPAADLLSRLGFSVRAMDPQWAGRTRTVRPDGRLVATPGTMDRPFGVARDVAAVVADLHARTSAAGEQIALLGDSLGSGPGVEGTMALNHAGRVELQDGAKMPRQIAGGIALAPYLAPSRSLRARVVAAAARNRLLSKLPVSASLTATLTHSPAMRAALADNATLFATKGRAASLLEYPEDMARIRELAATTGFGGKLRAGQSQHDALADADLIASQAASLGAGRMTLDRFAGTDHQIQGDERGAFTTLRAIRTFWRGTPYMPRIVANAEAAGLADRRYLGHTVRDLLTQDDPVPQ